MAILQPFVTMLTFFLTLISLAWAGKLSPTDTITWGGDNSRSGYQPTHNMDPAVIGSPSFGQIFQTLLPGNYGGNLEQIFSQPLVYTLDDGVQYVFVATTQNNVYKINAKTGAIVLSRNLHIPFLQSELGSCTDISPVIGVTATGVIDPSTDTWYLTTKTYLDQTDKIKGRDNGRYYFHAIDVNTLAEKPGFPKDMEGIPSRNTNGARIFQGGIHHQRPALLHYGQYIYAGFASHCVQYNFTGWVLGWDKTTGANVEAFATEGGPESNSIAGGGVWMSGGGIASDDKGSLYFASGNGYTSQLHGIAVAGRSPPSALEEAVGHMTIADDGTLKLVDFFMPWEKEQLDGADKDLGTSPFELLPPDVFTCPNVKRLGVVTGKSGKTYFLDIDNLGGYQNGPNHGDAVPQVTQNENSVYSGAGVYPGEGGYVYINVIQFQTHVFKFSCDSNGNPAFTKVGDSPEKNAFVVGVGHSTVSSLNGVAGTGLVWTTDVEGFNLRIYNAVPQNGALSLLNSFVIPGVTKFSRPVFGDARAYVGTTQGALYGFGSPINLPLNCSSPYDFGTQVIGNSSQPLTISCQANTYTQVSGIGLVGNKNFGLSGLPSTPFDLPAGANFSFQAVFTPIQPGPLSSSVLVNTTAAGFTPTTPIALKGIAESLTPLLSVTPNTLSFSAVITGESPGGVNASAVFSNLGNGALNITSIDFSVVKEGGMTVTPNVTAAGLQVGPFTFIDLPNTIAGKSQVTFDVNFNPSTSGNFAVYCTIHSNGGTKIFDVVATSGTYPVALLEFQAADGSDKWIPYSNTTAFTFGDVLQQQTKVLKMRLTNKGDVNAGRLSVTVSKPPFGVQGIIGAKNNIDLAEGTSLAVGESATADLFCFVPKSQVNVDAYRGNTSWTMNTGDPNSGKMFIHFDCNAVSQQTPPLAANGSALYRYKYCAIQNDAVRQNSTQLLDDPVDMTNEKCISTCAAQGYKYCFTNFERECWGLNYLPKAFDTDRECNYACTGDKSQTCGGNGFFQNGTFYLSVFVNPALEEGFGTNTPHPAVAPKNVGAYEYKGCYTEGSTARALADNFVSNSNMTLEYCATQMKDYKYWGVEFSTECYAGNAIGADSIAAPEGDCSMRCPGNSTELCGAGNRLTVYTKSNTTTSSTSATVTSTASPSASSLSSAILPNSTTSGTITPTISSSSISSTSSSTLISQTGTNTTVAISTVSTNLSTTSLPTGSSTANSTTLITLSSTATLTLTASATNSATSGNSSVTTPISTPANSTSSSSTSKSMTSSTNSTTSTTQSSPTALSATASVTTSTLVTSSAMASSPMTSSSTSPSSTSKSTTSTTASATSSTTASSSTTLSSTSSTSKSTTSASPSATTSTSTAPNPISSTSISKSTTFSTSSTTSGASLASPSLTVSRTTLSTTTKTTSSTSSTAAPTSTAPAVAQIPDWNHMGCYTEAPSGRALGTFSFKQDNMTVEVCASLAAKKYLYFGVEYSRECWASNSLAIGSVPSTEKSCNMPCMGNKTQICGGSSRLNVYNATEATKPILPTVVPGNVNFTYYNCVVDPVAVARALPRLVAATKDMTVEKCLALANGYRWAGLEFSSECWIYNDLDRRAVNATRESECGRPCSGNASTVCGDAQRLTLYRNKFMP